MNAWGPHSSGRHRRRPDCPLPKWVRGPSPVGAARRRRARIATGSKVTTEYPTLGESLRRNRIWGNFSTGAAEEFGESHEYCAPGRTTAREMLVAAAATLWKVPCRNARGDTASLPTIPCRRDRHPYGAVASLAAHMHPPGQCAAKDPKDWKIAASRCRGSIRATS